MKKTTIYINILMVLIFVGCSKHSSRDDKPPTLNAQQVPDNLRELLPLAVKWGFPDEASRSNKIASATEQDKQELQQALQGRAKTINLWLHRFPSDTATKQGMPPEARVYLYMMSAVDEMGLKIQ
jgi:hypothetical protein